jgi:hypothetical protein
MFGGRVSEEHRVHVTDWRVEVMGGPAAYTERHGGYEHMLARGGKSRCAVVVWLRPRVIEDVLVAKVGRTVVAWLDGASASDLGSVFKHESSEVFGGG